MKTPLPFVSVVLLSFPSNSQEISSEEEILTEIKKTQQFVSRLLEKNQALEERISKLETNYLNAFSGAVLAFNRKEEQRTCPNGWRPFDPGKGRFLVGAGTHHNLDENGKRLKRYNAYADDLEKATGGTEKQTLSESNIPAHSHSLGMLSLFGATLEDGGTGANVPYFNIDDLNRSGGKKVLFTSKESGTRPSGQNVPHNNMPPYVAVYFCELNRDQNR